MVSLIELAKSLSFRETAERLYMSQPALSYQIACLEKEIGFFIFERNGKSVSLTPAGRTFIREIEEIYKRLNEAIERGQNFAFHYEKEIRIGLPRRSYFPRLPSAIEKLNKTRPEVSVVPIFSQNNIVESFLKGDLDLIVGDEEDFRGIRGAKSVFLYDCPIRLLTRKEDVLTRLPIVKKENIVGRTLLVGSASRKNLQKLQNELVKEGLVRTMNSDSHDTSLTLVAAGKAICLSPAFYQAEGGDCAFLPFDTSASIRIVAITKKEELRPEVLLFLSKLKEVVQ